MKNKQAITLLFIANIISGFAQGISMLAIPWYFADILKLPRVYALGYAILTFLSLFWSLYSGTLIDKYSRKKMFLYSNLCCALLIGTIACFGIINEGTPWILALLVFGITMFHYNIHYPNLYAFGQEISDPKDYGKLNSYIEIQGQSTSIFAGGFAALLLTGTSGNNLNILGLEIPMPFEIEKWQIHEIFLMDSITYALAFIIILFIKYKPLENKIVDVGSVFDRLSQGINFLKSNYLLFIFGLCSYMIFTFLIVEMFILVPNYVSNYLLEGGNVFASSEVYYSIGAVISGISIRKLFDKKNPVFGVIVMMIATILSCFILIFTKNVFAFYFVSFIIGISNAGTRILRITYLFSHIPNHIIGRVGSVFNCMSVIIRTVLISIFTMKFFSQGDTIKWGYLIGIILLTIALIPLIRNYKKLVNLKATS
ncbi:MAG: MFS transporter [Flavobacteriales bacterium]|jgi:MFS family permease|tara:strand:+ start:6648 stop:7925 length:1278 start_codon:yes stop_codon:yes gene_type:complete